MLAIVEVKRPGSGSGSGAGSGGHRATVLMADKGVARLTRRPSAWHFSLSPRERGAGA
jgi:hypothetical protein